MGIVKITLLGSFCPTPKKAVCWIISKTKWLLRNQGLPLTWETLDEIEKLRVVTDLIPVHFSSPAEYNEPVCMA